MLRVVQTILRKNKFSVGCIAILGLTLIKCSYPPDNATAFKEFLDNLESKGNHLLASRRNGIKFIPTNGTYATHEMQVSAHTTSTKAEGSRDAHHPEITQQQNAPTTEDIRDRFLARNKLIRNVCQNLSSNETKRLRGGARGAFLSFAKGHFHFCRLRKVASSFFRDMNIEFGFNVTRKIPRNRVRRFLVVRDPYSRMVSGYIDRVVTFADTWRFFGRSLVKKFRPNATEVCGHDISFPEFVKYFIFSQKRRWLLDGHFVPMSQVCNPCKYKFHFVSHLETMEEDMSYILSTVNMTTNITFHDEKVFISGKSHTLKKQESAIKRCTSMCVTMRSLFWSFQTRGLIANHIQFPIDENECDSISGDELTDRFWKAHVQSIGEFDKSKQKRQAVVDLFLQVPLEERIKVRDLLIMDSKLFGYDPQPDDLFPELVK